MPMGENQYTRRIVEQRDIGLDYGKMQKTDCYQTFQGSAPLPPDYVYLSRALLPGSRVKVNGHRTSAPQFPYYNGDKICINTVRSCKDVQIVKRSTLDPRILSYRICVRKFRHTRQK